MVGTGFGVTARMAASARRAGVPPARLADAAMRAFTPKPVPTIDLFHVAPIRISVADAVTELADELPRAGRITFARLTTGLVERLEVIVRFLAVLELYKQGYVELHQADRCGDITIEWCGDPDAYASGDEFDAFDIVDVYDG